MNDSSRPARQLAVLRSLYFISYATLLLVASYIPLYFYSLGFTKLQIGAIYSVGPVLSIVANLLAGIISDRTKSLRRVISLLYAGQILALCLLLPLREFGVMAVVMALFYLFQTPVNSMLDSVTLLASVQLKRSFPSIRMYGSLGFAFFAVAFGYVLKTYGSNLTIALALASVAGSLLFSLLLTDYQASVQKFQFGALWRILRRRETFAFFAVIAFISVAHRTVDGFLAVSMRDLGASDFVIGVALLASAVSEIPVFFLLAKYGHRFREFPLLAIASFFYMIRMLLMTVVTAPWGIVAVQCLHSVSFGIFYITVLRCLQSMIPDEFRSSGQALFAVVWTGFAGLLAGTLGGWMYDAYGLSATFGLAAGFAFIGTIGFLLLQYLRPQA